MNLLLERGAKICANFAGNDEEGYRYVIGSHSEDVRVISEKLNEAFQGRGGGKPQMVQGSLKELLKIFQKFCSCLGDGNAVIVSNDQFSHRQFSFVSTINNFSRSFPVTQ